ncbi:MAG: hypothetical protein KatS3mg110_1134 [Pirellulaceae bacterium]|nr:MAG: hypothetical protein KatS3mg110_1134 [Pirellulaceae bacterium]
MGCAQKANHTIFLIDVENGAKAVPEDVKPGDHLFLFAHRDRTPLVAHLQHQAAQRKAFCEVIPIRLPGKVHADRALCFTFGCLITLHPNCRFVLVARRGAYEAMLKTARKYGITCEIRNIKYSYAATRKPQHGSLSTKTAGESPPCPAPVTAACTDANEPCSQTEKYRRIVRAYRRGYPPCPCTRTSPHLPAEQSRT